MDPNVIFGAWSQISKPAFNRRGSEDGPILAFTTLVGQANFVFELGIADVIQRVKLVGLTAITYRRSPFQQCGSSLDFSDLKVTKCAFISSLQHPILCSVVPLLKVNNR